MNHIFTQELPYEHFLQGESGSEDYDRREDSSRAFHFQ